MATSIDHDAKRAERRGPRDFAAEAKAMGLDVSGMDADAVRRAVGAEQGHRFYAENREWMDAHNRWYEENGDPLAHLRTP